MEIQNLLERLNYKLRKYEVQQLAQFFSSHPQGIELLFEISSAQNKKNSFHAAWVLENCLLSNKDLLNRYANELIKHTPQLTNNSVRRHFSKLLKTWLYQTNNLSQWISDRPNEAKQIIEISFDWMLSNSVAVSVKVHCMDILLVLSEHNKWIANELPHVMRLVQINSTPGLKAMARRMVKRQSNG